MRTGRVGGPTPETETGGDQDEEADVDSRDDDRPGRSRATGLPRLPVAARRALHADGLTTLDDVVEAGWLHVASLPGVDATTMDRLDAAITAVGRAGTPDRRMLAATA